MAKPETKKIQSPLEVSGTAIILAGGSGTRLSEAVPDLPKCMAPVAGQPFLYYVINHLRMQGIQKIIFSLGYKHEVILNWLEDACNTFDYDHCIEEVPPGTGGAIRLALQKTVAEHVFIVNGDTLFKFDSVSLINEHLASGAECTLALKPMQNFDRYGVVSVNDQHIITCFKEKQRYAEGLINTGVYLINKEPFLQKKFPQKFSFEKDYLEKFVTEGILSGITQDAYFIDIGTPEDYKYAREALALPPLDLQKIDANWTLFLDRDGVINEDKPGSYVFTADEFTFTEGGPALFKRLAEKFKRIIVITNQRGVGRGLIAASDLEAMHQKMIAGVTGAGGRIDKIYFATDTGNKAFNRKPNPGMALQALHDFEDIDFSKSIMVGNASTDMRFGRAAGMHTVFITSTQKNINLPDYHIDMVFDTLYQFSEALWPGN